MGIKGIKISTPTYEDMIPSTGEKVKLTPFRVGDEKTLLIAAQSENFTQMNNALRSVVKNCIPGINVDELEQFDIEYLFIKLRAKSVGEISVIGMPCESCGTTNEIRVELDTVVVEKNKEHNPIVRITDDLGMKLRYPEADDMEGLNLTSAVDLLELVVRCVVEVYTTEEVIQVNPEDQDDLRGLMETMTASQFEKVSTFFETMPRLVKHVEFTCGSCGHENKKTLSGLTSFF